MHRFYKINYRWECKKRKPTDDVLLEAVITSDIMIHTENTFLRWLDEQEKGNTSVDGKNVTCWYCGGVWLHYTINENAVSLYMHSSGEDAFDSLTYCANKIAEVLYQNHPDITIRWIEHPHRRNSLMETRKL
ncbi:TPA: hypothetical protein ACWV4T_005202 [Salmonella enterica subsp. enterica serovar Muenchen]